MTSSHPVMSCVRSIFEQVERCIAGIRYGNSSSEAISRLSQRIIGEQHLPCPYRPIPEAPQSLPIASLPEWVTPEEEFKRLSVIECIAQRLPVNGVPELAAAFLGEDYAHLTNWYKALKIAGWLEDLRIPPMPNELLHYMEEPCPFSSEEPRLRVKDTHFLFYIPDQVKDREGQEKPITLRTLPELLSGCEYSFINPDVLNEFGDAPVVKGWYVMTKEVIRSSRDRTYEEHQQFLARSPGYKMPSALTVTAVVFLEHIVSGGYPLGHHPWSYTHCEEMNVRGFPVQVGSFCHRGLYVSEPDFDWYKPTGENLGVVGLRKF